MLRILAEALTFDDVSLVPAHSIVLPKDVSLSTRLTRNISLNLPIVSAAMDTVTEARLAIAMAQLGGIGILHKNMSLAAQAAQVAEVKNFEAGVIREPFTVGPDAGIGHQQRGLQLFIQCVVDLGAGEDGRDAGAGLAQAGLELVQPAFAFGRGWRRGHHGGKSGKGGRRYRRCHRRGSHRGSLGEDGFGRGRLFSEERDHVSTSGTLWIL